jgi:lysozyme
MITAKDICKRFEGCELHAYADPIGIWSVGYGHTGKDVYPGLRISQEEADDLLDSDLAKAEQIVDAAVNAPINENQFQALVSFVFNVGKGVAGPNGKDGLVYLKSGEPSTLLRELNAGHILAASGEFLKWTHAGGRELPGLVKRRQAEKDLFDAV